MKELKEEDLFDFDINAIDEFFKINIAIKRKRRWLPYPLTAPELLFRSSKIIEEGYYNFKFKNYIFSSCFIRVHSKEDDKLITYCCVHYNITKII
jgi:hypothetical protein